MQRRPILFTFLALLLNSSDVLGQLQKEVAAVPSAQLFGVVRKVKIGPENEIETPSGSRNSKSDTKDVSRARPGDVIQTGEAAGASITLGNGISIGTARLGPDTSVKLPETGSTTHSLELLKGRLFLQINGDQLKRLRDGEFRLKTPTALLAVKGTRFFAVSDKQQICGTHEGMVTVTTQSGTTLLQAGTILELQPNSPNKPRQMTPAEVNIEGEYDKAKLDETPILPASPTQKATAKDGIITVWNGSKGYKDNPNGMYGIPNGERSEPIVNSEGVLVYSFSNPKSQDSKQYHEMQADIILRGESRKLDDNAVIAITFLLRSNGWPNNAMDYRFYNSYSTVIPTGSNILKVTLPIYSTAYDRFSEEKLKMEVQLPQREAGKNYQIEMWDFKLLTRPK